MTSTQLHAGYTAPASAAKKGASPLEKITAMLESCGIKIMQNIMSPLIQKEGGNVACYRASAYGKPEPIIAQFDAAFPQHKGALHIETYSAVTDKSRIILRLPAWQ